MRRLLGSELRTPGLHLHSIPRSMPFSDRSALSYHQAFTHILFLTLSSLLALASSSLVINTLSKRPCLCRAFHDIPSWSHSLSRARQRASRLGPVASSALWLVPSAELGQGQPQSGHWEKPVLVVDPSLCWPRGQGPGRLEE